MVLSVLGLLCLAWHTSRCPCISEVLKTTYKASQGLLKGTVLAVKALQGSETDLRELLRGMEENSDSLTRDFLRICPPP